MSQPSVIEFPVGENAHGYELSSGLARLCLPSEYRDPYRKLAWANAICLLFLIIGVVGLKAPKVIKRPLSAAVDVVPVIFTPPEELPKPEAQAKPEETEPQDNAAETPQVAMVVAVANPSSVAFPVPVQGAVAIARSAAAASPPPPLNRAPPQPVKFDPNNSVVGGSFPHPEYPPSAQRNQYQGTTVIRILVDVSGAVTDAHVEKSSGFTILDDAALRVVKSRWRFPPGAVRDYIWPCIFRLEEH
jgi:protein TonB